MLKYTLASHGPWSLHFYDQSYWTRAKYKAVGHTSKMSADDFAINKWRLYSYIYRYRHCWSIVLTFYWFYVWTPCLSCSESVCKGRGTWGHQSDGRGTCAFAVLRSSRSHQSVHGCTQMPLNLTSCLFGHLHAKCTIHCMYRHIPMEI